MRDVHLDGFPVWLFVELAYPVLKIAIKNTFFLLCHNVDQRQHTIWIGHKNRRIAVTDPKPRDGRQAAT